MAFQMLGLNQHMSDDELEAGYQSMLEEMKPTEIMVHSIL